MTVKNKIRKNSYHDSAALMLITNRMGEQLGTKNLAVMMGTDTNKDIMRESDLLTRDGEGVGANDLIIAARGENDSEVDAAIARAEEAIDTRASQKVSSDLPSFRTVHGALRETPDANIAVFSIPGEYARGEVMKALEQGLHVLLFSDNVSVEDEVALKDYALERELLMMGPDCGTAIINGTPLAFANAVDRGDIGIVAAAGTGLQETSVLISRNGAGISQGIGIGGRDVKEAVGGRMMMASLEALDSDPNTKVIVLVAKPPASSVVNLLSERMKDISKPVVTCFLGDREAVPAVQGAVATYTLEAAAFEAIRLSDGRSVSTGLFSATEAEINELVTAETEKLHGYQKYIRGLYGGGTLCYEAILIARNSLNEIYSNTPVSDDEALEDGNPKGNTFLDLGEDEFTRGRPHPMIEPSLRNQWIIDQAEDESVAVVVIDLVIGFSAHDDPAGVAVDAILEAKKVAREHGRYLSVVASVCGTEGDYQGFEKQKRVLQDAGVIVMPSNAQAVRFAVLVAGGKLDRA